MSRDLAHPGRYAFPIAAATGWPLHAASVSAASWSGFPCPFRFCSQTSRRSTVTARGAWTQEQGRLWTEAMNTARQRQRPGEEHGKMNGGR